MASQKHPTIKQQMDKDFGGRSLSDLFEELCAGQLPADHLRALSASPSRFTLTASHQRLHRPSPVLPVTKSGLVVCLAQGGRWIRDAHSHGERGDSFQNGQTQGKKEGFQMPVLILPPVEIHVLLVRAGVQWGLKRPLLFSDSISWKQTAGLKT